MVTLARRPITAAGQIGTVCTVLSKPGNSFQNLRGTFLQPNAVAFLKRTMMEPLSVVTAMHKAPRFGSSDSIARLMSLVEDEKNDYIRGVKCFSFFLMVLLFIWVLVLIVLKYSKNAGCANGGNIIDILELRKTPRDQRPRSKVLIYRARRLQVAFGLCAMGIPIASVLFCKYGLVALEDSMLETIETVGDVEKLTLEGMSIVESLLEVRKELVHADLPTLFDIDTYCSNISDSSLLSDLSFATSSEEIRRFYNEVDTFIVDNAFDAKQGFQKILGSTEMYERIMEDTFEKDWIPKMFILVLNVVNAFFFVGMCLSRHNVPFHALHRMFSYLLVPVFCVLVVLAVVSTCLFGAGTVMNSDFCSGGDSPGSAQGTVQDIFKIRGVSEQDMMYQSFMYYAGDCTTENPISLFAPDEKEFLSTMDSVSAFLSIAKSSNTTLASAECGADINPIIAGVTIFATNLGIVSSNVKRIEAMTSCFQVRPVFNDLFYGASCTDSVKALTWMFSSMLILTVFCLTMLSVRASLYNAVIRPPKEATPEEWGGYLEFMAQYYEDTDEWKWHPSPLKKGKKDTAGPGDLEQTDSYDTAITAMPSMDTEDTDPREDFLDDSSEDLSIFVQDKEDGPTVPTLVRSARNFKKQQNTLKLDGKKEVSIVPITERSVRNVKKQKKSLKSDRKEDVPIVPRMGRRARTLKEQQDSLEPNEKKDVPIVPVMGRSVRDSKKHKNALKPDGKEDIPIMPTIGRSKRNLKKSRDSEKPDGKEDIHNVPILVQTLRNLKNRQVLLKPTGKEDIPTLPLMGRMGRSEHNLMKQKSSLKTDGKEDVLNLPIIGRSVRNLKNQKNLAKSDEKEDVLIVPTLVRSARNLKKQQNTLKLDGKKDVPIVPIMGRSVRNLMKQKSSLKPDGKDDFSLLPIIGRSVRNLKNQKNSAKSDEKEDVLIVPTLVRSARNLKKQQNTLKLDGKKDVPIVPIMGRSVRNLMKQKSSLKPDGKDDFSLLPTMGRSMCNLKKKQDALELDGEEDVPIAPLTGRMVRILKKQQVLLKPDGKEDVPTLPIMERSVCNLKKQKNVLEPEGNMYYSDYDEEAGVDLIAKTPLRHGKGRYYEEEEYVPLKTPLRRKRYGINNGIECIEQPRNVLHVSEDELIPFTSPGDSYAAPLAPRKKVVTINRTRGGRVAISR